MQIVPRMKWEARQPKRSAKIELPTAELWLHHTAGNHRGIKGMQQIQNLHMDERGWWDIGYSFVVDPEDLTVYEGRGVGKLGGHTYGHNSVSHGIAVMGNFEDLRPASGLEVVLAELVRHGFSEGWWPRGFTGGHLDTKPTLCPGKYLYEALPAINDLAKSVIIVEPPNNKVDRLAERVWNLEVISMIEWGYSFYRNTTPTRTQITDALELAREEGIDVTLQKLFNHNG